MLAGDWWTTTTPVTRDPTFLQLFHKTVCNVLQERLFCKELIPESLEGWHQLFGDALGEVWWNRQFFFHCGGFPVNEDWECSDVLPRHPACEPDIYMLPGFGGISELSPVVVSHDDGKSR